MGDCGIAMYAMAMGGGQERDSALLGAIRCADGAMGCSRHGGTVVPVVQRDMVMAIDGIAGGRRRYIDMRMLVGIAVIAMEFVASRSDVDDTDRICAGDGSGDYGALLEIRDEHDGTAHADRAAQERSGAVSEREAKQSFYPVYPSIGAERDDRSGLLHAAQAG